MSVSEKCVMIYKCWKLLRFFAVRLIGQGQAVAPTICFALIL
jgi:hypothetical protein